MSNNRIMIVGTGSGCGKTTVTCALMKALKNRGLNISPFKCGPDYIDPMFHKHIIGKPSINLDLFFLKEEVLKWILRKHLADSDLAVIEGVMGMYDGIGNTSEASAYDVAVKTGTPMILVVNARGMSASICAMIQGYKNYGETDLLKGVILNNVGKGMYLFLKPIIEEQCGVQVLGYMERQEKAVIESRHLGLITADEIEDLDNKIEMLGRMAAQTIDLSAVLDLAATASELKQERLPFEILIASAAMKTKVKLAVAMDKAFCFYYEDNLDLFREIGIELLPFSPLAGEEVPKDADGIYLGGGYPEVYAAELSAKLWSKFSIRNCWSKGMPILAECGGFMYLHDDIQDEEGKNYHMCGIIPGKAKLTDKLGPFGYIDVTTKENSILGPAGTVIKGHEFHYSTSECESEDLIATKPTGKQWTEGICNGKMYAAYPHLYFYSHIKGAISFKQAMIDYHKNKNATE